MSRDEELGAAVGARPAVAKSAQYTDAHTG
jgi:hypothetical protein